ncbi:tetratricopeptide repeat protein [Rasiella rasia]|uniref:Tetratricopeptide repeat protein n=1 Tax=Rasiella rasia TaxID=2744027 RepID=A0A6G6GN44_9FLAO|nr:histidine kinase [Rasiella rasia]QIE59833.1 tetratricopeptide repeat protein [Rasiella rasia]
MKQLYILLVLVFGFSTLGFSQDKKADSLQLLLQQETKKDSLRVRRLLDVAYFQRTSDTKESGPLLEEAISISRELKDPFLEGVARRYLSQHYKRLGNFEENLREAIRSVELLDSIGASKQERMLSNSELAVSYQASNYLDRALEMTLRNLEEVKEDPVTPAKGRYYFDVGNAYNHLEDYSKAEAYYNQAISICEETNFIPGKMLMTGTLAAMYRVQKKYDAAKTKFNIALPYYTEIGDKRSIASVNYQLAMMESMQGNHAKSIPLYEKSLELYEEIGALYYRKQINQKLFVAYSILGDQNKAEAANIIYNETRDSIDSMEDRKRIAEMRTKYDTDKIAAQKQAAEARAALASEESKRNRNLLIGALIIAGLVFLSLLLYLGRIRATKKAELVTIELKETQKRLALEKQYRDSELKALKAQMNPHFIFNALNSIQEYIILNKKDLAGDYLGMFADLMRKYLRHSDAGSLTLQDEIESLQMYLDLEKLRFEETLMFTIEVSEEINKEITRIPTMLIQPYIENALKHGLLHKKDNRKLWITFTQKDNATILCSIEDNGVGRKKSAVLNSLSQKQHQSFATKATESRLDLLNYGKNRKIGVEIIDLFNEDETAKGTKVLLTIPTVTA